MRRSHKRVKHPDNSSDWLLLALAAGALPDCLNRLSSKAHWQLELVCMSLAAVVFGLSILSFWKQARAKQARRRREARGACIHCGYNLTGNLSGSCPCLRIEWSKQACRRSNDPRAKSRAADKDHEDLNSRELLDRCCRTPTISGIEFHQRFDQFFRWRWTASNWVICRSMGRVIG
jgi:hypothetical protein